MNPFFKGGAPARGSGGGRSSGGLGGLDAGALAAIRQFAAIAKGAKDPMAALRALGSKNPRIGRILRMVEGQDPQQAFLAACRQYGVDPRQILDLMDK